MCMSMRREAFLQSLNEFPEVHDEIMQIARERIKHSRELSNADACALPTKPEWGEPKLET